MTYTRRWACSARQLYSHVYVFYQAEDGIRDSSVTGVQTCALPISLRRNGLKYCSTRKVPLLKEAHAHVQGRLKFANEHLNDSKEDWETGCGQMRPKSSYLASTRLAAFGGGR